MKRVTNKRLYKIITILFIKQPMALARAAKKCHKFLVEFIQCILFNVEWIVSIEKMYSV